MINFNGTILNNEQLLTIQNRGFNFGDMLFETIKAANDRLFFWEDHYFRLMASMRIMRMEIPMNFTMEFLEDQICQTIKLSGFSNNPVRVKLSVFRQSGGFYLPNTQHIDFIISATQIENANYNCNSDFYEVDLFKDYYVSPSLLSTLKTNNKALNVIGSIYAQENKLNNCLILNTNKNVVEALNGNVFMVSGNIIKTPPLSDGCLKGVMRKQIVDLINSISDFELVEQSILPFELQKADELFITNVISGILPITKYRKKNYTNNVAQMLVEKINLKFKLN